MILYCWADELLPRKGIELMDGPNSHFTMRPQDIVAFELRTGLSWLGYAVYVPLIVT